MKVDGTLIGKIKVSSLSVGDSKTLSFSWTPSTAKTYTLTATADPENVIPELNESNNNLTKSVTVSSKGKYVAPPPAGGGGYVITPAVTTTVPTTTATTIPTTVVTTIPTTATTVTTATTAVTTATTAKPGWRIPGFEAIFAIAGLLAAAYLLRRREH